MWNASMTVSPGSALVVSGTRLAAMWVGAAAAGAPSRDTITASSHARGFMSCIAHGRLGLALRRCPEWHVMPLARGGLSLSKGGMQSQGNEAEAALRRDHRDVVILGGGLVGMALAIGLARHGISCHVVDP